MKSDEINNLEKQIGEINKINKKIAKNEMKYKAATHEYMIRKTRQRRRKLSFKKSNIVNSIKNTQLYRVRNICTEYKMRDEAYWRDEILFVDKQSAEKTCHQFCSDNCLWTQNVVAYDLNDDSNDDLRLMLLNNTI